MPYGNVVDDIARGAIVGRRIVNPPLKRTLYLVRPRQRAPFTYEVELLQLIAGIAMRFADRLGPLARRLEALEQPLSPAPQ